MGLNPGHLRRKLGSPALPFLCASAGAYFLVQSTWRKAHELEWARSYQASIPVVSVGNIAVGGTGKTPFVMYLVERLVEHGRKPCVISRGYGGTYKSEYVVVSDGMSLAPKVDANLVGDEPFLMASNMMNKAPVIVGRNRLKCIEFASENLYCDLAVLDDGFQHLRLKRDVDIVLLSGKEDHMFPLGILREPISVLSRADLIVLSANHETISDKILKFLASHEHYTYKSLAVCLRSHNSVYKNLDDFKGPDVLLVSAIANPNRCLKMVEKLEWRILDHLVYRDHYKYGPKDLTHILERAKGAKIIFTEKDWVKLSPEFQQRNDVFFLKIGMKLVKSEMFMNRLLEKLDIHGSQS